MANNITPSDTERSIRQIIELTYRYARGMDDRDWSEFASVFTEDASVKMGETHVLEGRQAVTDLVRSFIEPCRVTHHMMTNHLVDVDGDHATMQLYCRAFHQGSGSREGLTYECLVRYAAELVRVEGSWKIARWQETTPYDWGTQEVFGAAATNSASEP
jgi:uncharacterized protein (TIGR02246 family)